MADRKLTLPMTIDEIRALADRLEARGTSVLMRDQPAQCADLECAAHLLRFFAGLGAPPPNGREPLENQSLFLTTPDEVAGTSVQVRDFAGWQPIS